MSRGEIVSQISRQFSSGRQHHGAHSPTLRGTTRVRDKNRDQIHGTTHPAAGHMPGVTRPYEATCQTPVHNYAGQLLVTCHEVIPNATGPR